MADVTQAIRHVFQAAATTNGNGTAMAVGGLPGVGIQLAGITTATVNFEGTIDGTNWVALKSVNLNSGATGATATANGLYFVPVAGIDQLRARISGHSAGTITATGKGVYNPAGMTIADIDVEGAETVAVSSLPAGNLGMQLMAASLSVVPASNITDATYIGDIKFGEALPSGSATIGAVIGPTTSTATAISGQITVTTAGTAVQGPSVALVNGVYIQAMAANTGNIYVGNDGAGDVTTAGGFELDAGDVVILQVPNLNYLWFDASANAQKACWIKG